MDDKKVDITNYDEGLEYLAKELTLPVAIEDSEARKKFVMDLIDMLVRQ